MKITYIAHSGFAVQGADGGLLFDYYKGGLPDFDGEKPLLVFASHAHRDHFNPEIFSLSEKLERVRYLLSDDIRKYLKKTELSEAVREQITWVTAGEAVTGAFDGSGWSVRALGSTDCGVSFLVGMEGRTLFHAGDLNCWIWEEDSPREREAMRKEFAREVEKLGKLPVDAAFVPLDYRLRAYAGEGPRYFLEHTQVRHLFPMHLWEKYGEVERFKKGLPPEARRRVMDVAYPGQSWEI